MYTYTKSVKTVEKKNIVKHADYVLAMLDTGVMYSIIDSRAPTLEIG